MKHSMHFNGNAGTWASEEMSYAASHITSFVKKAEDVEENEFEGDHDNEVTFTTSKPINQTTINKIINHFQPAGHTFNQ